MSGLIGEAFVRIRPNMDGFQQETSSGFSKAFKDVAKIVGGALATEKIAKFGLEIVKSAADTKRATETISQGFGAAGDAVTAFNEGPAAKLGISAQVGQTAAAKFATLFDTLNIGKGQAAEMTVNLEKMAGGLSQIKGTDPSATLDALYSASAGATRGLKSLGIVIDANTIKQKAAELGLQTHTRSTKASEMADEALAIAKAKVTDALAKYGPNTTQAVTAQMGLERAQKAVTKALAGTTDALTPAQKTQAIYAALMDKLGGIQKSASAHSDDLAVSEKKLAAQWANLKDELGTKLLPVVESVAGWFADKMPGALKSTEDKIQDVAGKVSGPFEGGLDKVKGTLQAVADALQATIKFLIQYQNIFLPLSGFIGGVTIAMEAWTIATEVWTTVTEVATAAQKAFDLALDANVIGIIVLAIAGLVGALVVLYQRSNTVREVINEAWADIQKVSEKVWAAVRTAVYDALDAVKTVVVTDLKVIRDVFDIFKAAFTGDWSGLWDHVKGLFSDIWHGFSTVAGDVLDGIKSLVGKKALEIGLAIIEPFTHIPNWLGGGWAKDLKSSMQDALAGLESPAGVAGTNVGDQFGQRALTAVNGYMSQIEVAVANAWRNAQSSVGQATSASPNRASGFTGGNAPGASLGSSQINALVRQAGGTAAEAAFLSAISGREDSTGQVNRLNDNLKTHDYSVGLFQINFRDMQNQWMRGGQAAAAKISNDALAQAKYALSILHGQGPSAWSTNTPAIQALLGKTGTSTGGGTGGGGGSGLTVGTNQQTAAQAAAAIATARSSLEDAYKKVVASSKDLGGQLTGQIKKDMGTVRSEITGISSKADVTTARKNLADLKTEVGDQLKQMKQEIALNNTFDGLKTQVAKLGTDVTPQIRTEMKTIQDEIGKVSTPQQIANLKRQMTTVKNEIAAQLKVIQQNVTAEKSQFDGAWQALASGADAAFQAATNKALAAMQVTVSGAFASFAFGGSITQTPAEAALAQLTAAHDAAAAAAKLAADQAQLALDQGAAGDPTQIVADQAAVDDDLYQGKVTALQAQATLERNAATKQLQDAQTAYSTQRSLLQTQLDQRVSDIEAGMLNGTIAAAAGMNMLTDVLGDPKYGIDMQNSGLVIGGQLYKGLSDGLAPVFDLLQKLIKDMQAAGLMPTTAGDAANLNGTTDPAIAAALRAAGASAPTTAAAGGAQDVVARFLANSNADILAELQKQTALAEENQGGATVVVDGGANSIAKAVAR